MTTIGNYSASNSSNKFKWSVNTAQERRFGQLEKAIDSLHTYEVLKKVALFIGVFGAVLTALLAVSALIHFSTDQLYPASVGIITVSGVVSGGLIVMSRALNAEINQRLNIDHPARRRAKLAATYFVSHLQKDMDRDSIHQLRRKVARVYHLVTMVESTKPEELVKIHINNAHLIYEDANRLQKEAREKNVLLEFIYPYFSAKKSGEHLFSKVFQLRR